MEMEYTEVVKMTHDITLNNMLLCYRNSHIKLQDHHNSIETGLGLLGQVLSGSD